MAETYWNLRGKCRFLKEWPDWDGAIHEDEAQVQRQGRAVTYPFSFEIDHDKETGIFSSTTDIPYYETTLSGCTCYDFQERRLPCKHMYWLAAELEVIEIVNLVSHSKEILREIKSSSNIDAHPEQIKRIKKAKEAKCQPLTVDSVAKTAVFQGSGKKPYETNLDSCTCRDYFVRRLPCKHMYRLRMELEKNALNSTEMEGVYVNDRP